VASTAVSIPMYSVKKGEYFNRRKRAEKLNKSSVNTVYKDNTFVLFSLRYIMFQLFTSMIKYIILHSPDCSIIKYYDKTDEIFAEEYRKDDHYIRQTKAIDLNDIFCPSFVSSIAACYKVLFVKYIVSLCQVRYL
jgi:hypothetical protein